MTISPTPGDRSSAAPNAQALPGVRAAGFDGLPRPAVSSQRADTFVAGSPSQPQRIDLGAVLEARARTLSAGVQLAEATAAAPVQPVGGGGIFAQAGTTAASVPGGSAGSLAQAAPVSIGVQLAEAAAIAASLTPARPLSQGAELLAATDGHVYRSRTQAEQVQHQQEQAAIGLRAREDQLRLIFRMSAPPNANYPEQYRGAVDGHAPTQQVQATPEVIAQQQFEQKVGLLDDQVLQVRDNTAAIVIDVDGRPTRATVQRQVTAGEIADPAAGGTAAPVVRQPAAPAGGPWLAVHAPDQHQVLEVQVADVVELARLDLQPATAGPTDWYATRRDAQAVIRATLADNPHAAQVALERLGVVGHPPGTRFWIGSWAPPDAHRRAGSSPVLAWRKRPPGQ